MIWEVRQEFHPLPTWAIFEKVVRGGRRLYRLISKSQVLYLQLEANGLRCLPLATRRQIARAVEATPDLDVIPVHAIADLAAKSAPEPPGQLTRFPRVDFAALYDREEIHPGLIIIVPNVVPRLQRDLFRAALAHIGRREPVNVLLEADITDAGIICREFLYPGP
jgi:hypothetical protein